VRLCVTMWDGDMGADWPSGVQGICPVGCSVLGPLGALKMHENALWDSINAPRMPLGALNLRQNVSKMAYVTSRMTRRVIGNF